MPPIISPLLLVMLGAALGGGTRYLFSFLEGHLNAPIILSTLLVNILGGLLAGIITGYLLYKPDQEIRLFLIIGFCGGLTTFSSFSLEAMMLLQQREYLASLGLIALHLIGAIGATFIGFIIIQKLLQP